MNIKCIIASICLFNFIVETAHAEKIEVVCPPSDWVWKTFTAKQVNSKLSLITKGIKKVKGTTPDIKENEEHKESDGFLDTCDESISITATCSSGSQNLVSPRITMIPNPTPPTLNIPNTQPNPQSVKNPTIKCLKGQNIDLMMTNRSDQQYIYVGELIEEPDNNENKAALQTQPLAASSMSTISSAALFPTTLSFPATTSTSSSMSTQQIAASFSTVSTSSFPATISSSTSVSTQQTAEGTSTEEKKEIIPTPRSDTNIFQSLGQLRTITDDSQNSCCYYCSIL